MDTNSSGDLAQHLPSGMLYSRPVAQVAEWLRAYIARLTGLPVESVDIASPFEEFGMDSYQGVVMAYELEAWLGCALDMSEPFEHPSIVRLIHHLVSVDGRATSTQAAA